MDAVAVCVCVYVCVCVTEDYYNDWWATAYNYQLRMPQQRFIYSLGSNTCVAYAYW